MNAEIEQILTELQEYFDENADAEWDYDQQRFRPSSEMTLAIRVERLKELLNEKTN